MTEASENMKPGEVEDPHLPSAQPLEDDTKIPLPLSLRRAIAIVGIIATAATIMATLAGIFITLVKMHNDDLVFKNQQLEELNKGKELERETAIANKARENLELDKIRFQLDELKVQAGLTEEQQLAIAIRNFQSDAANSEAEITVIGGYLGKGDKLSRVALSAFATRLEQPRTAAEVKAIFSVLPTAGIDGLPVAILANRRGYKEMEDVVARELLSRISNAPENPADIDSVASLLGEELLEDRALSKEARLDLDEYPESVAHFKGIYDWSSIYLSDHKSSAGIYSKSHPLRENIDTFSIWTALIGRSVSAIEEILKTADRVDVLNFNRCFLPTLQITRTIKARRVVFLSSYIYGADLSGLSYGIEIALADATWTLGPFEDYQKRLIPGGGQRLPEGLPLVELNEKSLQDYREIRLPRHAVLLPPGPRTVTGEPIEIAN